MGLKDERHGREKKLFAAKLLKDDTSVFGDERVSLGLVGVSADEVLQDELGVLEVAGIVVVSLSVHAFERLLQVQVPVDELLHVLVLQQVAVLLDQLLGPDVAVLVEQTDLLQGDCVVSSGKTRPT